MKFAMSVSPIEILMEIRFHTLKSLKNVTDIFLYNSGYLSPFIVIFISYISNDAQVILRLTGVCMYAPITITVAPKCSITLWTIIT